MVHHQISKLLNDSTTSKFVARKWIEVNDFSSKRYSVNRDITFKAMMLGSYLCDYSDAYTVVNGTINLSSGATDNMPKKLLHLKITHHLDHA